jgi:hypothetical protein
MLMTEARAVVARVARKVEHEHGWASAQEWFDWLRKTYPNSIDWASLACSWARHIVGETEPAAVESFTRCDYVECLQLVAREAERIANEQHAQAAQGR